MRSDTAREGKEECEVALEFLRDEKIFLDVLVASFAQLRRYLRMRKQVADLIRGSLDGMRQQSRVLVDDLDRNAAHGGGHHRFLLPERFGDGEAEPPAYALLHHDRRCPLRSVNCELG